MGLDTKTYWLTDRQSQCDFDFLTQAVFLSEYSDIQINYWLAVSKWMPDAPNRLTVQLVSEVL
jgi:hypothetical protein